MGKKQVIFTVRFDDIEAEKLRVFAERTQRSQAQAVRAAISIAHRLFISDDQPGEGEPDQTPQEGA